VVPSAETQTALLLRCIRRITPQLPITWKGNCAIWMPGDEAQERQLGRRGPGYL
jgi:hypothetical protein